VPLNNVGTQSHKKTIITGDNRSVSLANIVVHYILRPIADVLREAELFSADLSMTNLDSCIIYVKCTYSQALASAFTNSGFELTFHQAFTAE